MNRQTKPKILHIRVATELSDELKRRGEKLHLCPSEAARFILTAALFGEDGNPESFAPVQKSPVQKA